MILTNRKAINQLRDSLKERNADSTYSSQFLYELLLKHAKWLIRREESSGRIYRNNKLFQTLRCVEVMEVPNNDCGINTGCELHRTVNTIPEMWEDSDGVMIKSVSNIDNTIIFQPTTQSRWPAISSSPYYKYNKTVYYLYHEGYIFFPGTAPKAVNITAFFKEDVSSFSNCGDKDTCKLFLDQDFFVPEWIEGEIFGKTLEELAGVTKKMQEDEQIDSNPTRKS